MSNQQASLSGHVRISGAFECRDKDGNVIKTIPFTGSVPLKDLPPEAAQQLESHDGLDNR